MKLIGHLHIWEGVRFVCYYHKYNVGKIGKEYFITLSRLGLLAGTMTCFQIFARLFAFSYEVSTLSKYASVGV